MATYSIYKKLAEMIMTGHASFKEGEISFMGQRMQLTVPSVFAYNLHNSNDFWRTALEQYAAMKNANVSSWFEPAIRKKLEGTELIKWAVNYFNMAGWGIFSFKDADFSHDNAKSIFIVDKNAVAESYLKLFGKSKHPICHLSRGGIAGGAGVITNRNDIEVIETECLAQGYGRCRFVAGPRHMFKDIKKEAYRIQIGLPLKKK